MTEFRNYGISDMLKTVNPTKSPFCGGIKSIRSKTTEKRWRHHFPHYKSMGAFCCHGNQFQSNLRLNLMQPFPYPNDATHKIWSRLANWLHRYSSSKVWNFRHSRALNSNMSGLIRPKIELNRPFMPVLVTSNFDDDSIKTERASMETPFSHYQSMENFLDAQGQITQKSVVWSGLNSNLSEILCMSSLPINKNDRIKSNREKVAILFSPICQWGLSVAMDTRVLIQSASKHYASFPHHQWCYT